MLSLEKKENKVTQSTLRSFKVKRAKIGYTFHPTRIPPYIFFKMCNPFYIGLKLPNVNEALWNRMVHGAPSFEEGLDVRRPGDIVHAGWG